MFLRLAISAACACALAVSLPAMAGASTHHRHHSAHCRHGYKRSHGKCVKRHRRHHTQQTTQNTTQPAAPQTTTQPATPQQGSTTPSSSALTYQCGYFDWNPATGMFDYGCGLYPPHS